jgi:hypothetical protein
MAIMMEKTFNKEKHIGYKIGEDISIHCHINDPESWFLTIRKLSIHGDYLCEKTCTEEEIARYIHVKIIEIYNTINELLTLVLPLT